MSSLNEIFTKLKLEQLLDVIKRGKTEEVLKNAKKSDISKLQKTLGQLTPSDLKRMGLNIENLKNELPEEEMDKLNKQIDMLPEEMSQKIKQFLQQS